MKEKILTKTVPLLSLTIPVIVLVSLHSSGIMTFFGIFYAFLFIPALEFLTPPMSYNLDASDKEQAAQSRWYDLLLYLTVPVQLLMLADFLWIMQSTPFASLEWWGRTMAMGIACGVIGINVGHELGHRTKPFEQLLAKILLMTSLYMHFFIEHNKGHHRNVSTPKDPASARKGEMLYSFLIRSIFGSALSAWRLDRTAFASYMLVQAGFCGLIYGLFGMHGLLAFIGSAVFGFLLLEVVNYIEHYGLIRKLNPSGRYEKVTPIHSWNSDHLLGRGLLFNLSRHSDHHAYANKKYQILESYPDSPQMPTGYPGMILLALVPPLWFKVMNARIPAAA